MNFIAKTVLTAIMLPYGGTAVQAQTTHTPAWPEKTCLQQADESFARGEYERAAIFYTVAKELENAGVGDKLVRFTVVSCCSPELTNIFCRLAVEFCRAEEYPGSGI